MTQPQGHNEDRSRMLVSMYFEIAAYRDRGKDRVNVTGTSFPPGIGTERPVRRG
jgi:hypothetical protein